MKILAFEENMDWLPRILEGFNNSDVRHVPFHRCWWCYKLQWNMDEICNGRDRWKDINASRPPKQYWRDAVSKTALYISIFWQTTINKVHTFLLFVSFQPLHYSSSYRRIHIAFLYDWLLVLSFATRQRRWPRWVRSLQLHGQYRPCSRDCHSQTRHWTILLSRRMETCTFQP